MRLLRLAVVLSWHGLPFALSPARAENFIANGEPGHHDPIMSAAFSPDGRTVLTAGADKKLRLWDAVEGREIVVLEGHKDGVFAAAFSPDGGSIVSASGNAPLNVWSFKDRRLSAQLKSFFGNHLLPITALSWTPDGKTVISGSVDGSIKFWNVSKKSLIATVDGPQAEMANDLTTGSICVYIPESCVEGLPGERGDPPKICTPAHTECKLGVMAIAATPDGKKVLTGGGDGLIAVWSLDTRTRLASWKSDGDPILSLAISRDGQKALSGTEGNRITLWDIEGKVLSEWRGHEDHVTSVAFSPDGTRAVSGSRDTTVKLWSVATGETLETWRGHSGEVRSVAFSPDGKRVLSAGMDGAIRSWNPSPPSANVTPPAAPKAASLKPQEPKPPEVQIPAPAVAAKIPAAFPPTIPKAPPAETPEPPAPEIPVLRPAAVVKAPDAIPNPTGEFATLATALSAKPPAPPAPKPADQAPLLGVASEPQLELLSLNFGGKGVLSMGEPLSLTVTITNKGMVPARNVAVTLESTRTQIVVQSAPTMTLAALTPGESKAVDFTFLVKKSYSGRRELPLTMSVVDGAGKFWLKSQSLSLTLGDDNDSIKARRLPGASR